MLEALRSNVVMFIENFSHAVLRCDDGPDVNGGGSVCIIVCSVLDHPQLAAVGCDADVSILL